MDKWMLMYSKNGKPSKMSRRMPYSKALHRYMKELDDRPDGISISLIKVVATNDIPEG